MFKGKFFSSKKSGSSSPDGSNSPGSLGSNSPVRSEKKKVKSTKEDSQTASVGIVSLRSGSYRRTQVKTYPNKKDMKNKESSDQQLAQVNGHPKPSSLTTVTSKSTLKPRRAAAAKEVGSSAVAAAASPISASSLGLNRIKTKSGPLPQESFFGFRGGAGGDKGYGLGLSSVSSKLGGNECSGAGSSSVSISESTPASGDNGSERRVRLQGSKGNVNRVDKGSTFNSDSSSAEIALSFDQTPIPRGPSRLQNGVSSAETGWHNVSCVHSEELRSSNVCTPDILFDCENPKESESPRFQAVLRVTSAPRKRFPTDIKSFSHELNSKGVRPYPFWKPRGLNNLEEVLVGIRAKFDKAKEEVNTDLATFAGELVGILEKNAESHPDWQETIEDLLVLARSSALMSPGEFWIQCEGIVQDLDDKRQELPMGMLKHLHTRMLFILTRCTRLLQFHKESGLAEGVNVPQLRQSRILRSVDKQIPPTGKKVQDKSYSQEQHGVEWKRDSGNILSPPIGETPKIMVSPSSRDRISSWKQLPSPLAKPTNEPASAKVQNERKDDPPNISCSRRGITDVDMIPNEPPLQQSPTKDSHVPSSVPSKHQHKVSWGYWGDQANISDDNSIICRICEEEVPTLQVEDHSRICALADRCDQKGLSVDERLLRVAETLDKMIESSQKDIQHVTGSPNIGKNSNLTGEFDVLSPKYSDWSRRGSEDMLDCLPESDNSMFMDDFKYLSSMSFKNRLGPKSDQGMTTSSGGSVTPRSPLLTPRTSQIDLLLAGKYSEHDDHPQMNELVDIARCVANAPLDEDCSISYLLSCLEDLSSVIERRKANALTVETFGTRIEKLIREKYLQLCELVDDEKVDFSSTVIDEDSPLEDDIVRSLRASPSHPASKDRTSIDDFEIIKPISRGAFGRVFLAKKRTTGDLFAIKVLRKADMIRKNAVESILAERDILISVRNPFVVRFFYSFTCRDNLYLVMEYLNGGDLYSLLRNLGCLDEEVVRVYIAEVVLALDYLHSLNVVHRDLKPDNLLIAHDGHIKLTDFGLSRVGLINSTDDLSGPAVIGTSLLGEDEPQLPASDNHRERRKKRSAVGTPDYLAPEILLGTGHGATADWWSVGVILFEMIVGIPPFNAEHPEIIFDNIVNRKILWPRIPDEMSEEAQDLIDRLLTEDPHQRLGARGAPEVKQHAFFKNINWDTLARQKAAFVPASESCLDTSYFRSRYSWNGIDEQACEVEELSDNGSSSSSCLSNRQDELVTQTDECGGFTEFDSGSSVNYSFSNFSFKNLSQLASINYDLLTKGWKDDEFSAKPRT